VIEGLPVPRSLPRFEKMLDHSVIGLRERRTGHVTEHPEDDARDMRNRK